MKQDDKTEVATFAAGCFWGVEEAFRNVGGVIDTEVGYAGGHSAEPTYEQVCGGGTGHAESVRVHFDPKEISYEELLKVFWDEHDPTQKGGQGLDQGSQYRSVVFYHDEKQQKAAESSRDVLAASGRYDREITTEIEPAGDFYLAEDYHQNYIAKGQNRA